MSQFELENNVLYIQFQYNYSQKAKQIYGTTKKNYFLSTFRILNLKSKNII